MARPVTDLISSFWRGAGTGISRPALVLGKGIEEAVRVYEVRWREEA